MNDNFRLPYIHLTITLQCQTSGSLPVNKTSMLRGVIGTIFKKNVCHDYELMCKDCKYINTCIYPALFESPTRLVQVLQRGGTVPHPYIIRCHNEETRFQYKDNLTFEFILMGKEAASFVTYLYHVFDKLQTLGMGKDRVRFKVVSVTQKGESEEEILLYNEDVISAPSLVHFRPKDKAFEKLSIQLITPLRMLREGKVVRELKPQDLLWQVQHRWKQLSVLHGIREETMELPEIPADSILFCHGEWSEVRRFSNKQKRSIALNGLKGTISIANTPELQQWLPYLQFGELFHVGKATTFGLGQYEIWYK
ncbi:CRISPR system precrRNA processing endoribonuclease RAMP protein Cas6 [Bacillus sp. 165]|uniref:CRISPR system precrRNA processing endoribonuclease RAMP protein Cas6 n=1 Tax=Bacillus sp. 165 TaxID=1529117 RepID=UPI001ADBD982|nr:CRISPR system precrRNA processing endoribonuclease RAMP protein Cas6 [Bacillus sp. 165]MBO9129085.1 CRISPR system precrRNA processing endoribonuclease RAMP protein Cas6 [Bacillus sp. 165]